MLILPRIQPTYEELKPACCQEASFSKNRIQPTYEELKRCGRVLF